MLITDFLTSRIKGAILYIGKLEITKNSAYSIFLKEVFYLYSWIGGNIWSWFSRGSKGNHQSLWKLDDWVAVEYDNTWYPDDVAKLSPIG